jgi:hypothetical protein
MFIFFCVSLFVYFLAIFSSHFSKMIDTMPLNDYVCVMTLLGPFKNVTSEFVNNFNIVCLPSELVLTWDYMYIHVQFWLLLSVTFLYVKTSYYSIMPYNNVLSIYNDLHNMPTLQELFYLLWFVLYRAFPLYFSDGLNRTTLF